jgi:hypothetical protein
MLCTVSYTRKVQFLVRGIGYSDHEREQGCCSQNNIKQNSYVSQLDEVFPLYSHLTFTYQSLRISKYVKLERCSDTPDSSHTLIF